MTRTFRTDGANDLTLDLVAGTQAIADNCKTAMQAQRGEMIYAADRGMPTLATAWDRLSLPQFEAAAREVLRRVPGVRSVEAFTARREGEVLRYTATIQTDAGPVTLDG